MLSRAAARSSHHPIEYLYHFSRGRLERQRPQDWDLGATERDPDLAGHFLVALTTGVLAYGLPAEQVFRRVTDGEFLASVGADVREGCEQIRRLTVQEVSVPVYQVLNFARTLAWTRDRAVLSKRGGGHWLMERDRRWTGLLAAALEEYADPRGRLVPTADLRSLARVVSDSLTTGGNSTNA